MNFDPVDSSIFFTEPEELEETKKLLTELKTLSESEIKSKIWKNISRIISQL